MSAASNFRGLFVVGWGWGGRPAQELRPSGVGRKSSVHQQPLLSPGSCGMSSRFSQNFPHTFLVLRISVNISVTQHEKESPHPSSKNKIECVLPKMWLSVWLLVLLSERNWCEDSYLCTQQQYLRVLVQIQQTAVQKQITGEGAAKITR